MAVPDSQDPTFIDALNGYLAGKLLDVHVCLPGRLTSYDKAKQTGDVQVCVRRLVNDGTETAVFQTFPKLHDVPIDQLQSANFFASFPIASGDFVWVHFVEQSIDTWLDKGGGDVRDPVKRRFDLRDCYATLARNPTSPIAETESDSLVIGGKGGRPRAYFQDSLITLGSKSPGEFVALATKANTAISNILANLDTNYALIATGIVAGGGTYSPVTLGAQASVAATKVKAE